MRLHKTFLLVSLMSALVLSSCGFPGNSVTPDTTSVHSDGSPEAKPTHTSTPPPVTSYAFVRQDQLWVSFNGRNPIQVTHINYSSLGSVPNIFWGQPLWSPGDGFIAFILKAFPGYFDDLGACPPGIDYANPGALYVLNTRTLQLTRVVLTSMSGYPADNDPLKGFWQHLFWEDATHLLASSSPPQSNTNGSLFRYDLNTKTLSEVIPAGSLKPFGILANNLIWFPLRYSSGQLFYQVIEADPINSKNILFVIYRHSTLHPELPSTKVLETGSEPIPVVGGTNVGPSAACPLITNPGWDISPDGKRLVAQMLLTDNADHVTSSIRVLNLADGSMEALFGQVSSNVLTGDLTLTWGPDNQSVLLSSWSSQVGPYSATLVQPAQSQAYPPDTIGHVVWRSDGSVFALFQFQWIGMGPNSEATVYMCTQGKPDRRLFLMNAQNFAWG